MKKLQDYDGYMITPADWGYYITIGSTPHNVMITYEYDGACGTYEEVEDFLKTHTFEQVRKAYAEQYVYKECEEQIY